MCASPFRQTVLYGPENLPPKKNSSLTFFFFFQSFNEPVLRSSEVTGSPSPFYEEMGCRSQTKRETGPQATKDHLPCFACYPASFTKGKRNSSAESRSALHAPLRPSTRRVRHVCEAYPDRRQGQVPGSRMEHDLIIFHFPHEAFHFFSNAGLNLLALLTIVHRSQRETLVSVRNYNASGTTR